MNALTQAQAHAQSQAQALDAEDALAPLRQEFHLPQVGSRPAAYFCGHSLGLQPRRAAEVLEDELRAWQRMAVAAHFSPPRPWLAYQSQLAAPLAMLVGAQAQEVVAMNSLSVNLHLLMASFYRPTAQRHKILIEGQAFPSDRYAVASQIRWHGYDPANALLTATPRQDEVLLRQGDLFELIAREGSSIALVLLPGVQYLTGQRLDIRALAAHARKQGCAVGFDLAHAVGNVPIDLHDSDVDFAVWCTYKYLNGGPGAVAAAFVHERHAQRQDLPRLAGWWGHDQQTRFAMPEHFVPMQGAAGWQVSNPPILALAPLLASMECFTRAGFARLREKSRALTAFLADCLARHLPTQVTILTPADPEQRGCQLSLRLNVDTTQAKRIHQQLLDAGIICDWREPNVMRAAPVPLYNTFSEVWTLVAALKGMMA
jgi:kynureninase